MSALSIGENYIDIINSLDNAPMELLFGKMKTEILNEIAMCRNDVDAMQLVSNYITFHNCERYSYDLAGLTPEEYYYYTITGVYPCDSYFGIKAEDMMSAKELAEVRLRKAREKAETRRKAYQKRIKTYNPLDIMYVDKLRCETALKEQEKIIKEASNEILRIKDLDNKIDAAIDFYNTADDNTKEALRQLKNWKNYPELSYIKEIEL